MIVTITIYIYSNIFINLVILLNSKFINLVSKYSNWIQIINNNSFLLLFFVFNLDFVYFLFCFILATTCKFVNFLFKRYFICIISNNRLIFLINKKHSWWYIFYIKKKILFLFVYWLYGHLRYFNLFFFRLIVSFFFVFQILFLLDIQYILSIK